MISINTNPNR